MRKIIETVREYDTSGNLTREVVTETTEEGDAERLYSSPPAPTAWWGIVPPVITCKPGDGVSVPSVWTAQLLDGGSITYAASSQGGTTPT